ncbi:MAG: carboxypeptidase regulatory-like domain-containing protein [Terracidiphilus sp.]
MKTNKITRIAALASIVVVSGALSAFGQNSNSGEIKGQVTDASGAVVPGASVTLLDTATGVSTKTQTNDVGIYDVPSLPTGPYSITFSKTGFRNEVRNGVVLQIGTIAIDASLQVGQTSLQVVVTADAPQLQTEDSSQHEDFNTQAVVNAPIVGGVWYNELTNELPGVNGGGGQDASGQGIGVNGTQAYSGSFLIEGSTAQQPRDVNASDNYPPTDAIGEVNVQTSNFGAQYGNGVATFNVLLKSGTNRFHGSLFEFNQNNDYNALPYFDSGANASVAPLHWNEFGGSIGGPIIKNKLFFFFTYQRNPNTSSGVYTTTVPTTAASSTQFGTTNMEAGCFPGPVTNPNTGNPFAGNCITSTFDKVAASIQKYFPAPNLPGYLNNYRAVQSTPTTSTWYVGKVDYTPNQSHRISGYYMYFPISPLTYNVDAFCSLGFDCTVGNNYNQDAQITDVWTISPTKINEARIGNVREVDKYIPGTYGKGYPTTIGLEPTYGTNSPGNIFPTITVNSGGGIGGIGINGGVHADLADGSLVESDIFTLIKGKHTIKMGGEFDKSYQNYTNWGDVTSGSFVFDGSSTNVPYADFLLGDTYSFGVTDYAETGARSWMLGTFAQDDYKVLPHLTVNIGLRYQYQGGWSEVHNRWGSYDPTLVNTGQYANGALGAITYGGQHGRNDLYDGTNEWAPRVGFSWSPIEKWAFRASYGITDVPWSGELSDFEGGMGFGFNPSGYYGYHKDAFQLQTGPPAGTVVTPTLATLTDSQYNYDQVAYYPAHRPATYYQESLLSVQHELPFQMLVDASYVYTKGTHLNFERDTDQVMEGNLSKNPNSYCATSAQPNPLFCTLESHLWDGYSNYNALQLRAEKRASHGLYIVFNYAWSKTMDTGTSSGHAQGIDLWQNAYDIRANYGLSQLDVRNTINGSASYELPFGIGKQFALHGVMDEVLGGWRATGVYQIHGGIPFTPTTSSNGSDLSQSEALQCYCGFEWLPNQVASASVPHPSVNEWFNPAAFATPTPGTFGNIRRNTLTGPNWRDLDLSMGKTFLLMEGMKFEIRADSFNFFNHPNFQNPSAATGTGVVGGGVITATNGNRDIQLGGRLTF